MLKSTISDYRRPHGEPIFWHILLLTVANMCWSTWFPSEKKKAGIFLNFINRGKENPVEFSGLMAEKKHVYVNKVVK